MFATGFVWWRHLRYQHGGASASPRPLYRHQTQEMPPPSPVPEQQQPQQQQQQQQSAEEEQQLSLEPVEKTPSKERPGRPGDDGSVYWPYFQSSPWNQHDVLTIQPSQIMQYDEPSGVNALPTTPRARQHQQNLQQAFIAA